MIDFTQTSIKKIVVHQIGCRAEGEDIRFSNTEAQFQDEETVSEVLKQYFFKPFKTDAYFNFHHEEGLDQNIMFGVIDNVFNDSSVFHESSVSIANHLFEQSNHPKIRGGEFYMVLFSDVVVDGEVVDALGIFKSENKDTFLKVMLRNQSFELGAQEGINIKKLDKGCLIFNTERELGFKICSVDNINKGNEAHFWHTDFLGLKPREDNYYFTNNYLQMCKGFVNEVFNDDNDISRPDQVDLLNRSIEYFGKNANFDERHFEKEVIRQPEVVDAFHEYKSSFTDEKSLPLQDSFDISKDAVKSEKKHFKSVLKLDKNFHVYVHGKRQYIEKGFDSERGLKFYKLFFESEE